MYVLCVSLFPSAKRQDFSAFTPTLCVVGNAKAKSSRAGLLAIFAATTSLIFAPILSTLRLRLRALHADDIIAGHRGGLKLGVEPSVGEARACRRSYSGGVVVARGACRRAADECGEQRDGRDGGPFHGDLLLKKVGRAAKRRRSATANYKLTMPIGNWPAFAVG